MSLIDWRRERRRIVLPVALLAPATGISLEFLTGRALLDTGATSSGITPRMAARLDLEGQGKRPLNSAHGEQQTERYIFRIGLFPDEEGDARNGDLPFFFDEVDGFALQDSFSLDALIGMDVIGQCDFFADRSGRCVLAFGHGSRLHVSR